MTSRRGRIQALGAAVAVLWCFVIAWSPHAYAQDPVGLPDAPGALDPAADAVGAATEAIDGVTDVVDDAADVVDDVAGVDADLGGVTDGVADTVDDVTDTVDEVTDTVSDATGGATDPITDPIDDAIETGEEVVGGVIGGGNEVPRRGDSRPQGPEQDASAGRTGPLGGGSDAVSPLVPEEAPVAPAPGRNPAARASHGAGAGPLAGTGPVSERDGWRHVIDAFARALVPSAQLLVDAAGAAGAPTTPNRSPWAGILDQATEIAKHIGFPLALALIVAGFLALHHQVDRRDPKLALAPVDQDQEVLYFE